MSFALLFACLSPDPSGEWVGTHEFQGDDQISYSNAMSLEPGGSGDAVLYSIYDSDSADEPEVLGMERTFELTWSTRDSTVSIDFNCTNCFSFISARCEQRREAMSCEGDPPFYEDEASFFAWKR